MSVVTSLFYHNIIVREQAFFYMSDNTPCMHVHVPYDLFMNMHAVTCVMEFPLHTIEGVSGMSVVRVFISFQASILNIKLQPTHISGSYNNGTGTVQKYGTGTVC